MSLFFLFKSFHEVGYSSNKIVNAVLKQFNRKFKKNNLYGDGKAGARIAKILSNCKLDIIKKLNYLK